MERAGGRGSHGWLTVVLGVTVAMAVVLLSGCSGGYGPTLPSPDGTEILEARVFGLQDGDTFIRGARLNQFIVEERLCGSEANYLAATAVRLEEDRDFSPGEGQANLVLLLDESGSMGRGTGSKLEQMRAAANELVDRKNAGDQMAIVPFDETPDLTQAFTADAALLHEAINEIAGGSGTAAWDSTLEGLVLANNLQTQGGRAVVLMSDGRDSRSESTLDEAIADAQARGIPVFAIGFQTEGQANTDMRRLATETGGQFLEAETQEDLAAAFFAILRAVQGGQYTIFWRSNFAAGTNAEVRITYTGRGEPIELPPACQVILGGEEEILN